MERLVRTYYVPELDTLDIWIGEPDEVVESEEVGDGVIVKLNKERRVIGIEIISLSKTRKEDLNGLPQDVRKVFLESIRKLSTAASHLT